MTGSIAAAAAVFAGLLLLGQLSGAAAASARPEAAVAASAAFTVRGTNGYSVDVESERRAVTIVVSEGGPPVATFSRSGAPRPASTANGAASIYRGRDANPDPGKVNVRLGQLGRISVSFHPSGRSRVTKVAPEGPGCGGPTRIVRRLGTFRGTVEFLGEARYTSVQARSARGSVGTPLPSGCAGASRPRLGVAGWGAPRGATLRAANRRAGIRFKARTAGSGTAFVATWRERLERGVVVSRRAYAEAPRGSFEFDRELTAARVAPPAPFSGTARFDADRTAGTARWAGSLRATFPGGAVPMTGPGFRTRLEALR